MTGEEVEAMIVAWLKEYYPEGPGWQKPDFDCYGDAAFEIKMLSAQFALEYNIGNGGWGQLLWNCFGSWRELTNLARIGYERMGLTEHAAAITPLREALASEEPRCAQAMRLYEQDDDFHRHFGSICDQDHFPWEQLFWDGDAIEEARHRWLEANQERIRVAVLASREGRTAPQPAASRSFLSRLRPWLRRWGRRPPSTQ